MEPVGQRISLARTPHVNLTNQTQSWFQPKTGRSNDKHPDRLIRGGLVEKQIAADQEQHRSGKVDNRINDLIGRINSCLPFSTQGVLWVETIKVTFGQGFYLLSSIKSETGIFHDTACGWVSRPGLEPEPRTVCSSCPARQNVKDLPTLCALKPTVKPSVITVSVRRTASRRGV